MNIDLPSAQQNYLQGLVACGRFRTVDDAIREGVDLLIGREDLKQKIQEGIDQADSGEVIDHDTVFRNLRAIVAPARETPR